MKTYKYYIEIFDWRDSSDSLHEIEAFNFDHLVEEVAHYKSQRDISASAPWKIVHTEYARSKQHEN